MSPLRARSRHRVGPPPIEVHVSVLAFGLIAATIWGVMAAGWVDNAAAVMLVGMTAVAAAVFLVRASVGRLPAAVFAPVLGLAVIVPMTHPTMPPDGGAGVRHLVLRYGDALVAGLFSSTDWTFLVGLCAVLWLVGFWLGWCALGERRGVVAVLPCLTVLGADAVNGPTLERAAVPGAVALGLAVFLIAQCRLLDLTAGWRRRGVPALPGLRGRFSWTAACTVLLIIAAGAVTPALSSHDFTSALLTAVGRSPATNLVHGGTHAQVAYSEITIPGGPLSDDHRPVLTYTVAGGGNTYLWVATDTVFRDGNWYPQEPGYLAGAPTLLEADYRVPPGALPRDRSPADGGTGMKVVPVTVTVRLASPGATGGRSLALFPGEPDQLDTGAVARGIDGTRPGPSAGPHLLAIDSVALGGGELVTTATGTVSIATPAELRSAAAVYPAWIQHAYLGVGSRASPGFEAVASLATSWSSRATNRYDQAAAIEAHLRSDFRYSLSPPAAPAGTWPIVDFLTRTHQGYCQYYAASMGLMLRSLGIPARLVTGYGPGSEAGAGDGARRQVTTSDAHVWVQAYLPPYGWIDFEPTPPSGAGDYQPFTRGTASSPPPPTTSIPGPTARRPPAPAATPPSRVAGEPPGRNAVPLAVAGAVAGIGAFGAIAGLAVVWLARPRSPAGAWRRLTVLARAFCGSRRPSETRAAYASRLAAALPPDPPPRAHREGRAAGTRPARGTAAAALALLAATSGREQFAPDPLSREERLGWVEAWRRLLRLWPLLLWRRLNMRPPRTGTDIRS